jgi:hypothetical protein
MFGFFKQLAGTLLESKFGSSNWACVGQAELSEKKELT